MTINKSQGQTLKRAGIWLPRPIFAHGQLYVGMGRVGDPDNLKMVIFDGLKKNKGEIESSWQTINVVYKEVLNDDANEHTYVYDPRANKGDDYDYNDDSFLINDMGTGMKAVVEEEKNDEFDDEEWKDEDINSAMAMGAKKDKDKKE